MSTKPDPIYSQWKNTRTGEVIIGKRPVRMEDDYKNLEIKEKEKRSRRTVLVVLGFSALLAGELPRGPITLTHDIYLGSHFSKELISKGLVSQFQGEVSRVFGENTPIIFKDGTTEFSRQNKDGIDKITYQCTSIKPIQLVQYNLDKLLRRPTPNNFTDLVCRRFKEDPGIVISH